MIDWKCSKCGEEMKTEDFVVMTICGCCMVEMKKIKEVDDDDRKN